MPGPEKELCARAEQAFANRAAMLALWQDIAENFYPERADFTASRYVGEEFAKNLLTSYPVIVRRDLGNYFSSVLRPRNEEWASMTTDREERIDNSGRRWLEEMTIRQRREMYDPKAGFTRATKEGDHDFAAFGQCVLSVEMKHSLLENDKPKPTLLYRCWHLRDVAWQEDETGAVGDVFVKHQLTAQHLVAKFGDKVHSRVKRIAEKQPYTAIPVMRIVLKSADYAAMGGKRFIQPYASIYLDVERQHVMEAVGSWTPVFRIPRWQTVSGSQFAYSPATVAGLPDARLLQAMTLTLLEAGEFAVRPPMLAKKELTTNGLQLFSGGVTMIDADYDERMGDVVRPLTQDTSGMPLGLEMQQDVREMLATAFFLNKLSLPPPDKAMTAYEASVRVKEYIRAALPLFEPVELEYNAGICEDTFELLFRAGCFGPAYDIPQSLRGRDLRFKFKSPLYEAVERNKAIQFSEAQQLVIAAQQTDQTSITIFNTRQALRDALTGTGAPATWQNSEEESAAAAQAMAEQAQAEQRMEAVHSAATTAEQAGKAEQALNEAA
jgi:hypothetical protein